MSVDIGSKQKIMDVATRLFSTKGLKNTNIRQIASEAKTNSALIFYYFGCKEKLFYECLTELASERFKVAGEILTAPEDKRDFEIKLSLFIQNMFEVFQSKRDLIKILHKEIDNENSKALKIFEGHFLPVSKHLEEFLNAAQKKKIISKEINVKAITFDFFGMISNPLRNEVILKTIFKNEIAKHGMAGVYKEAHGRILGLFLKGILALFLVVTQTNLLKAYSLEDYIKESSETDSSVKATNDQYEASTLALRRPEEITAIRLFSEDFFADDSLPVANPNFQGSRNTTLGLSLGLNQQNPWGFNWSLSQNVRKTKIFGTTAIPQTDYYDFYPSAEMSIPLWRNFAGAEVRAQRDALTGQTQIQNIQSFIEKESKLIDIEKTYYRYGIQQNLYDLAKKNLDRSVKLYSWISQRKSKNLVDDSDALQARASLSLRKLEYDRADRDLRLAIADFNSYRVNSSTQSNPTLDFTLVNTDEFRKLAQQKKISLFEKIKALQSDTQKNQARVEAQAYLPKLDLKGSFILQGRDKTLNDSYQNMNDDKRNRWTVGVSFQTPLDITYTRDVSRAAALSERAAQERLKRSVIDQELSWVREKEDLLRCAESLDLLRDLESSQRNRYLAEEKKYRNGRSTLFLVLSAEQDFINSESQKWANELQCRIIKAQTRLFSEEG